MNKAHLLALALSLFVISSPVSANCSMMGMSAGMDPGMEGMDMNPGMAGMDMGGGMMSCPMMGMMGMGRGMMGHPMMGMGMGRGQQACMMQNCWQDGTGSITPQSTVHNVFREINGYQAQAAVLGLNEDQIQRLDEIRENLQATAIRTHADLQINGIELRRGLAREKMEAAAVEKAIDRQTELWSKLQKTAVKAVADARNVLTAQQRQQARKLAVRGPATMQMPQRQPGQPSPPDHQQHH